METKLYSIGRLSKATGTPITTVRKYSDLGLLVPRVTDPETGYRYYDESQFWQLELIRICRDMGMPYPDIRQLMNGGNIGGISENIREKLFAEMTSIIAKMKDLDTLQAQWAKRCAPKSDEIKLVSLPERKVPYVMSDDPDGLHAALLEATELSEKNRHLKFGTGYIFDADEFARGKVKLIGEFFDLDPKSTSVTQKNILTLPEGSYLCGEGAVFKDKAFVKSMNERLIADGLKPSLVIAQELYMPLLDWKTIDYKVQILV